MSSSSLLSLTAEISKQKEERAKSGTVKKAPAKKPTLWGKKNLGVAARAARDSVQVEDGPPEGGESARSRAMLEKKAQLYEKIKRGKSGGLSEGKIASLLVDFDRKNYDDPQSSGSSSGSSSDSESDDDRRATGSTSRSHLPQEEDLVEYVDDFGRTRLVPRSDLPRGAPVHSEPPEEERNVLYGDQHSFPVYEPDEDVLAAKRAALAEHEPLVAHFDGTKEIRTKGAGFYQFSADGEERRRQMEDLERRRRETVQRREENLGTDEVEEQKRREREREEQERGRRRGEEERKRTAAKVGFVEERNPKFARAG